MPPIPRTVPPPTAPATTTSLRVPQIRVLQALATLPPGLGMTRARLSEVTGNRTGVMVGRAVGYSNPAKRTAFEQTADGGGSPGKPCPSLLTLGYVKERPLDLDGLIETHVILTDAGRQALEALGDIVLPQMGDSYAGEDGLRKKRPSKSQPG